MRLASDKEIYLYRTVECINYTQEDSCGWEKDLEELQSAAGTLQMADITVAKNPYHTTEDDSSTARRRLLLKYEPDQIVAHFTSIVP